MKGAGARRQFDRKGWEDQMDAYMIQRWERTKELAEECGIKVTVRDFIAMFDSRGLNLGCHATVDEAYAFMCGYAARSERCEGN